MNKYWEAQLRQRGTSLNWHGHGMTLRFHIMWNGRMHNFPLQLRNCIVKLIKKHEKDFCSFLFPLNFCVLRLNCATCQRPTHRILTLRYKRALLYVELCSVISNTDLDIWIQVMIYQLIMLRSGLGFMHK